jgi:septal ring factor EnvC (AmiA/AmiB activator)
MQIVGEVDCIVHTERRIPMTRTVMVRNLVAVAAITIVSVGLSGCDYWPPALQTQIEQLRSELQAVTMEKAQLENQYASFAKVKDDLQAQVDDLSRSNRDKSVMINSLQSSLTAAQGRLVKSLKVAPTKAAAVKPSAKVPQMAPAKKKAPAKKVAPAKKKAPAKAAGTH